MCNLFKNNQIAFIFHSQNRDKFKFSILFKLFSFLQWFIHKKIKPYGHDLASASPASACFVWFFVFFDNLVLAGGRMILLRWMKTTEATERATAVPGNLGQKA